GREAAARAGKHDDADIVVVGDLIECRLERHHDIERHRVHPLRPVERHQRDVRTGMVYQHQVVTTTHGCTLACGRADSGRACYSPLCSAFCCAAMAASMSSSLTFCTSSSNAGGGKAPAWLNTR